MTGYDLHTVVFRLQAVFLDRVVATTPVGREVRLAEEQELRVPLIRPSSMARRSLLSLAPDFLLPGDAGDAELIAHQFRDCEATAWGFRGKHVSSDGTLLTAAARR